jgi:hypothetical protein
MTLSFSSLSGGTSFTVVTSTGGSKTATLDKSYPAGTYLIESKAMDTNLEVYLGASDGTQVGTATAGAKTITASASFLYVTTVNADANDAVIFTLKSAATLATKTDAVWAPPTITDITPSGLPNANNTTTITGTNFATNVDVKFRKSDDSTLVNAKTTVRGSATSIIATRPDTFAVGDAPYDVIVTNPSTNLTATSLNAITAGAVPVWVTSTTLNTATLTQSFSQTISATDSDGGSTITYAIVSGALPTGLSLNSSTGAITGTPTGSSGNYTVTISATDSGGNAVNRTFTQTLINFVYIDYVIVAGGGGAGSGIGAGGGGGGGFKSASSYTLQPSTQYTIEIGGGGSGGTAGSGNQGTTTTFKQGASVLISTTGGGYGAPGPQFISGGNGGSGGGSSSSGGYLQGPSAGTGVSGEGNNGGRAYHVSGEKVDGGGGGGAGAAAVDADALRYPNGVFPHGGAGASTSITGSTLYFAGGGGGGGHYIYSKAGNGGIGGGGGGAGNNNGGSGGGSSLNSGSNGQSGGGNSQGMYVGGAAGNNSGGGGGGGGGTSTGQNGGNGGSGVFILRSTQAATSSSVSPTTYSNYYVYTFTNNGNITF